MTLERLEDRTAPALLPLTPVPGNDWTGLATVGDFNGDAIPDVVTPDGYSATSVSIRLGNSDGSFAPALLSSTGPAPNSRLAVGDFDRDGCLDVVTTHPRVALPEVQDGHNMLLVSPDDPPALVGAIAHVLNDRALRARLQAGAHQLSKVFGWDNIAAETVKVFERVKRVTRD